jgi:hypothetical protein
MKRIADYQRLLDGDKDVVRRLINEWQPSAFGLSEKDYEQELYTWFTQNLRDVPIIAQYGIAKGKADIVIQDEHVIELKLGFWDVCEFDRCLGQLQRYRLKWVEPERGPIYLILVGESDPELRDVLYQWLCRTCNGMWLTWFHVAEKRPGVKPGACFWEVKDL